MRYVKYLTSLLAASLIIGCVGDRIQLSVCRAEPDQDKSVCVSPDGKVFYVARSAMAGFKGIPVDILEMANKSCAEHHGWPKSTVVCTLADSLDEFECSDGNKVSWKESRGLVLMTDIGLSRKIDDCKRHGG